MVINRDERIFSYSELFFSLKDGAYFSTIAQKLCREVSCFCFKLCSKMFINGLLLTPSLKLTTPRITFELGKDREKNNQRVE